MPELQISISNGKASVSGGGTITDPTILAQAKAILRKIQDTAEQPDPVPATPAVTTPATTTQ